MMNQRQFSNLEQALQERLSQEIDRSIALHEKLIELQNQLEQYKQDNARLEKQNQ